MVKGSIVALVTPMHTDGTIDKKSLHDLIEWHIDSKTDGIVVAGSTGEAATLNDAEHSDLISTVVKQVKNRIPVIAGTGSASTHHTIELTLNAKKAGADACLVVTPYYNKPPQNGLFEHYKTVAEKTGFPVILYNVPGRTACDLLPETVERLAQIKNIIGIKDATSKMERAADMKQRCGNDFLIWSGDDDTALELMLRGADGVISVTANVAPQKMHEVCQAVFAGDKTRAQQLNDLLMPLHKNLFLEANPIPVKWGLYEMGRIPEGIRLPLLPLNAKFHDEVRNALRTANALK